MKPFKLENHYRSHLPEIFYSDVLPMKVEKEELVLLNEDLARDLEIDPQELKKNPGYFSGRILPLDSEPIAQAYSGHQFGFYTRLGDGRAILLGEWQDSQGELWDIQLKGAGRTPYSRGGDGKAAFAPMLREYLISESMAALGIPTTRSLALVLTGHPVYRQETLPGAMLTRVAKSHLRVGTFQYALEVRGEKALKELADYAIERHYPEVKKQEKPYLSFLIEVINQQAKLLALWMSKGFIHGVMNTDNMTISGETIDYGPCAFMDYYDPETVFSSIDTRGRYAYGNQPTIAQWNLTRLAEALLPLLTKEGSEIKDIEEELILFKKKYKEHYLDSFRKKLGLLKEVEEDGKLIKDLLTWMLEKKRDFTNSFVDLTEENYSDPVYQEEDFLDWKNKWEKRQRVEEQSKEDMQRLMRAHNPYLIPRNHKVEEILQEANKGNLEPFTKYLSLLEKPYSYEKDISIEYREPMSIEDMGRYQTFCGT